VEFSWFASNDKIIIASLYCWYRGNGSKVNKNVSVGMDQWRWQSPSGT